MRSPWNGGSITLRRERCSAPSSSSSERAPTSGCSVTVPPRRHLVPALAVQRADDFGARHHHQRRLEALERDAERVAVAAPAVLEEADRPRDPARGLHGGRLGRAGGERSHRTDRSDYARLVRAFATLALTAAALAGCDLGSDEPERGPAPPRQGDADRDRHGDRDCHRHRDADCGADAACSAARVPRVRGRASARRRARAATAASGTPPRGRGSWAGSTRAPGRPGASPLGAGSAPHGVIVGPDGAAWITDGGLNAIVRVDAATHERATLRAAGRRAGREPQHRRLRPATGRLWFTGQAGCVRPARPARPADAGVRRPARAGPVRHHDHPRPATSTTPRSPGATSRASTSRPATVTTVDPPTPGAGRPPRLVRLARAPLGQRVERRPGRPLRPGDGRVARVEAARATTRRPTPSTSTSGLRLAHRLRRPTRSSASTRRPSASRRSALPATARTSASSSAAPGEVWGAESGTDRLVVARF